MRKLIFATGNEGKLREIRAILSDLGFEVLSMKEAGVHADIEETGTTFLENALIKARIVCRETGEITMADDSGLVVDALDGMPGVYSARWLGEDTSYRVKNAEIIRRLSGVPEEKRTARFMCAAVCVFPDGRELTSVQSFEGRIAHEEHGTNGFGYDPIFYLPDRGCASAELTPEEKNAVSHRGKALRDMKRKLEELSAQGELS